MDIVRSLWSWPDIFLWVAIACLLIFGVAQTAAQFHDERSVHVESGPQRGSSGPQRSVWHFVEQSAAIVGITSFLIQVAMWIYFWPPGLVEEQATCFIKRTAERTTASVLVTWLLAGNSTIGQSVS